MTHARELPPIRKAIEVDASPAEAFRLRIGTIGRCWPPASHSVAQADALACTIEARTGGRIFEITRAHEEHVWGQVTMF